MILLDTSAVYWLLRGNRRGRPLLKLPRLHLSPASVLEFQILAERGRVAFADGQATSEQLIRDPRWRLDEPPAGPWFVKAGEISWTDDPFDRLLAAHARLRGWKLATSDQLILDHLPPSECLAL